MEFNNLYSSIIDEKKAKLKPLSGFDYYKSIRKPTPKPGSSFKDKSKYNRKEKHKKDLYESVSEQNYYKQISDLLSAKGMKAFEQTEILDLVHEAIRSAFKEGYKASEENPFR